MNETGLDLLLDRSWQQEVIHQLVLRELLRETAVGRALSLWSDEVAPTVLYEPFRGLFDLALADTEPRMLIELKVGAELGDQQRARQRVRATELGTPRAYVLLGQSFFMALEEPDARNIGTPELAVAIRTALDGVEGPIADLGSAYLARLEVDARRWDEGHESTASTGLDLFRLYRDMAAAWPVETRPSKATHPGGVDWIINGNAWTTIDRPGWELAEFYWEMVNGFVRCKFYWRGADGMRLHARTAYRSALEAAAEELGEVVRRTRTKLGRAMTGIEILADGRAFVLVDGQVSSVRSRELYDRTTALFRLALERLPDIETT